MFQPPVLTKNGVRLAYVVAVTADVIQLLMGPPGWAFADQTIDIAAAILISRLIGFHVLLLPAFVLEFLPVADMLPTWTGCVALVVMIHRKQQAASRPASSPAPPTPDPGPFIDV